MYQVSNGWHRRRDTAATKARADQYASRQHRELRRTIQARIDRGEPVACWRCHHQIHPGQPWHLGHDDNDRTIYRGAEHPGCNVKAAARKGARVANARRKGLRTVTRRALL